MGSPLDSTYGVWLISIWLQTLLQGCGMLQIWLYFHWYKNDRWGIKAMVYALLIIETFQIIVFFQVTYLYLIDGFGNVPGLLLIHWQDSAQLLATYLSAFIVQMYFAYCIYVLEGGRKLKPLTLIIVILGLTQIGSGLAQTIIWHVRFPRFPLNTRLTSFAQLDSTKAITTLEAASAFTCDVMITIALVRNLGKNKGGVKATNNILTTLMINAINRGMLTALCALQNLILFLAIPNKYFFFIGIMLSGKLYMNSALATLNSRSYVMKKSNGDHESLEPHWNSIQMSNTAGSRPGGNSHVRVVVTKRSDSDTVGGGDQSYEDHKGSSTLIGGMI